MKTSEIILAGSAALIGIYLLTRPSEAQLQEGLIIVYDTSIYGNCSEGKCVVNELITISVTFKNIGLTDKQSNVAISVNNVIVKDEVIALSSNEEYIMTYDLMLDELITYNICGVVK